MATQARDRARRKDAGQPSSPKKNKVFRDFGGINTQAARQAIQPGEFSWLENVQPIGHGNAKAVPDRTLSLQSVASGTCYYMAPYNISGLNYMFMACGDGTTYQVALDSPYTRTSVGTGFSVAGLQIAQWKNERIMIADPLLGLYSWDGTILTKPGGLVAATMTANGTYTAIPTWTVTGGGGAGGAVSSVMDLAGAQTITNAGTGYVVGDVITLTGGTYTTPGKLKVLTIGGGGAIASVSILAAGSYTVLPTAPVATTGGGNNDATITPAYEVISLTVTNQGTVPYNSAPVLTASAGAATADAVLMAGPTLAEHVATFSGRVWVSFGRTLAYSAPLSYYDFAGTSSGSTIITDETLHSDITQLISANNFLYFTGIDSINVIGDVSVNSLGDTVFSNTNLSASVGTDFSNAIIPYFRAIFMQNRSGVYSVFGATPTKASDNLDGIFPFINFTPPISAGCVVLQNILCACFLFQYNNGSGQRPLIAIYFNKKWFVASQGNDLTFIAGGEKSGVQNLYGTDGTNLYQLFARSDYPVPWIIQPAYWDMEDVTRDKQITKFGLEMGVVDSVGQITVQIEALTSQAPGAGEGDQGGTYEMDSYTIDASGLVTWLNNLDTVVLWENNALDIVGWFGTGYFLDMQDGTGFGKYIGLTISSQNVRGNLFSALLEYTFRDSW